MAQILLTRSTHRADNNWIQTAEKHFVLFSPRDTPTRRLSYVMSVNILVRTPMPLMHYYLYRVIIGLKYTYLNSNKDSLPFIMLRKNNHNTFLRMLFKGKYRIIVCNNNIITQHSAFPSAQRHFTDNQSRA